MSKTVNSQDRDLFEKIYITATHILIGNYKLPINGTGLFNQIRYHLQRSKRHEAFSTWLCTKYGVESLTSTEKAKYEGELLANERNNIYSELLRIRYTDEGGIEFYGVVSGNKLVYLVNVMDGSFYNTLAKYLKFNKTCMAKAKALGYSLVSLSVPMIKKEIDECLEMGLIPEVTEVKVLSNRLDEYCLAYFDLSTLTDNDKPTPAWDNFINQFDDELAASCFMGALYSLYVATNRSRQIIYLHAPGSTGKSVVANVINDTFRQLNDGICTALASLDYQDKFSSSSYENKWLILAADNKDYNILRSTLVKNITGNDWVATVKKGQDQTKKHLFSRIFATSNKLPWCDPTKDEDLSRLLLFCLNPELCKKSRKYWDIKTMGDWATKLREEVYDFLGKCKKHYENNLSQDGHNLNPYPDMITKLNGGMFYVQRDIRTWWDACIQPYSGKKATNVLRVSELVADYLRFIGTEKGYRGTKIIRSFLSSFLMDKDIQIIKLSIRNELVIKGYEFKEKSSSKRINWLTLVDEEVNALNDGEE